LSSAGVSREADILGLIGELFGFDRTRDLSTRSAEEISNAAQAFGQNDDITVLTLSFT
jgi:hypothetical protein